MKNFFLALSLIFLTSIAFAVEESEPQGTKEISEDKKANIEAEKAEIEAKKKQLDKEIEQAEEMAEQQVEEVDDEEEEIGEATIAGSDLQEIAAEEYIILEPLIPLPEDVIRFSKDSASTLYRGADERVFVYLTGRVLPDYEVKFGGEVIKPDGKKFKHRLELANRSGAIPVEIKNPEGEVSQYQYLLHWKRVPSKIGLRVMGEGGKVTEISRGLSMVITPSAFPQLYEGDEPAFRFDAGLEGLNFKLISSNLPTRKRKQKKVRWEMTIIDADRQVVGRKSGKGLPPEEIKWEEIAKKILSPGEYVYYVDLAVGSDVYRGNANRFVMKYPMEKRFVATSFQLSHVSAFMSGGSSFSGELSWNPTFTFNDKWGIRGHFGFSAFKKATSGSFISAKYQALATYQPAGTAFSFEMGGGAQTWVSFGGTRLIGSFNIALNKGETFGWGLLNSLKFIDRVYLGYTAVIASPLVHQVNVGVGIRI